MTYQSYHLPYHIINHTNLYATSARSRKQLETFITIHCRQNFYQFSRYVKNNSDCPPLLLESMRIVNDIHLVAKKRLSTAYAF